MRTAKCKHSYILDTQPHISYYLKSIQDLMTTEEIKGKKRVFALEVSSQFASVLFMTKNVFESKMLLV